MSLAFKEESKSSSPQNDKENDINLLNQVKGPQQQNGAYDKSIKIFQDWEILKYVHYYRSLPLKKEL